MARSTVERIARRKRLGLAARRDHLAQQCDPGRVVSCASTIRSVDDGAEHSIAVGSLELLHTPTMYLDDP